MGKYLDELGVDYITKDLEAKDDDRSEKWKSQRAERGFDDRDTWSLDSRMIELFYELTSAALADGDVEVTELNSKLKTYLLGIEDFDFDEDEVLEKEIWNEWREVFATSDTLRKINYDLVDLLNPRLKRFLEVAIKAIDLEYHQFSVDDEKYTQLEAINLMIELSDKFLETKDVDTAAKLWNVWSMCYPAMWW